MCPRFSSDVSWVVELLQEWGSEQTSGVRRGAVWSDSEIDDDGDEMRSLKQALHRLLTLHPVEYAAIVLEFASNGRRRADQVRLTAAIERLAVWVDEDMDGQP